MRVLNQGSTLRVFTSFLAAFAVCSMFSRSASAYRRPDHEIDRINAAIDALDRAHEELNNASDDYHGHKRSAIEKLDRAKKVLEDSRDAHVDKAVDKIQEAIDELKICVGEEPEDRHPRIRKAMHALEDAKDQL